MRSGVLTLGVAFAAMFALAAADPSAELPSAEESIQLAPGSGVISDFLACKLPNGSGHYGGVTPADMPWRVSIGIAKTAPRMGTRKEARAVAIESMRQWERAIQTHLPWFALEFVTRDRDAPVQIKWKRRTTGKAQGRAGPTCKVEGDRILAGGRMDIAVQACPTCSRLTLDSVRLLVAHEFGHILGLGHCLECDSAMNYSWETVERVIVTEVDVAAVVQRFALAEQASEARSEIPDPEDLVELATDVAPLLYEDVTCKKPFALKRSCSSQKGPRKQLEVEGVDVLLAASKDGSVLFMTPIHDEESLTALEDATRNSNEGFRAVTVAAGAKGVIAVRAMPLNYGRHVLGYLIEFDGDAWSALGI